ncbi:hypothetical protein HPB47_008217 [Ixodes persulcatus]|uniref:Uncharacterized protein n=1 Tax=Ixodes persulcatus TaxID=34615 RepID=A0AC60P5C9_IXOPE|nr:hypothetical protein HPB47_008217 [Ixodes persulcatus]
MPLIAWEQATPEDLETFTSTFLRSEAERRGLDASGTKSELIDRIILDIHVRESPKEPEVVLPADDIGTLQVAQQATSPPSQVPSDLVTTLATCLEQNTSIFARMQESSALRPTQLTTLPDWSQTLPRAQKLASWNDDALRAIAQAELRGTPKNWHIACGDAFPTWPSWRAAFLRQFNDDLTLIEWQVKLSECLQSKNQTLHAYTFAKLQILARSPVQLTDKQRIEYLLQGLRDDHLVSAIAAQRTATVDEFIAIATDLDNAALHIKRARPDKLSGFQRDQSPRARSTASTSEKSAPQQPRPNYTSRQQHYRFLSAEEQNARYDAILQKYGVAAFRPGQNLEEAVCFHCRQKGHLASKCPSSHLLRRPLCPKRQHFIVALLRRLMPVSVPLCCRRPSFPRRTDKITPSPRHHPPSNRPMGLPSGGCHQRYKETSLCQLRAPQQDDYQCHPTSPPC